MIALFVVMLIPITRFGVSASPPDTGSVAAKQGLMWNRSGLPAVFPLQVKSNTGRNYFLTLTDTGTGKETLAAYFVGGSFFKVLVPPGTYTVRFAYGDIWQGETHLFGPDTLTKFLVVKDPLTFKTSGAGTKAGHLISLENNAQDQPMVAQVRGQFICQALEIESAPLWQRDYARNYWQGNEDSYRYGQFDDVEDSQRYRRFLRPDFAIHGLIPRYTYSVRSRFCR